MATVDHTPGGRGYHTALHYFHHDNDYWSATSIEFHCSATVLRLLCD